MVSELTEADIPGAALEGWAPEVLKISELNFGYVAVTVEPADYPN